MKAPATPENETDRLNSLRESGLLEIDSSPAFDRLTRLAKRFFQVPLAMVNLIDEHNDRDGHLLNLFEEVHVLLRILNHVRNVKKYVGIFQRRFRERDRKSVV